MLLFGQLECFVIHLEECGMFRGLYTSTAGMMAYQRQQQVLSSNLSNSVTPGYKSDQTVFRSFPQQLIQKMGASSPSGHAGSLSVGMYAQEAIPLFTQGALKQTGSTTDFALQHGGLPIDATTNETGALTFAVRTADDAIRYSQNGQFQVDPEGYLITSTGERVQNAQLEDIRLTTMDFQVDARGQLTSAGQPIDSLWIGYTGEPKGFVKEGNGLLRFEGQEGNAPQLATTVNALGNASFVMQGYIEESNVDISRVMTDMLRTYRGFESNQKVLQAYDQSMQKAVTEIGRV